MMYLDKVAELLFFSEMEALAESSAHTATFEGLDKMARRTKYNPKLAIAPITAARISE